MRPAAELSSEQLAALEQAVNGRSSDAGPNASTTLAEARVDLIERIREGLPPIEYVPGGDPWLRRGKRYLLAAGAGTGKSLLALVAATAIVEEGGTVAILDVENGADEYARRLADVLEARDDDRGTLAEACSERLRYFEWPALSVNWPAEEWIEAIGGADLVIFDSSRLILSAAGLSEDANDDYAKFVEGLLFPLARSGVATMVLDNTGHEEKGRARGASAKADLNEVVYVAEVRDAFDRERSGSLILKRKRSRFADLPLKLRLELGGGAYGRLEPFEDDDEGSEGWRPTRLMQRVSEALEAATDGLNTREIRQRVSGDNGAKSKAIEVLVAEGFIEAAKDGRATVYRSLKAYREGSE